MDTNNIEELLAAWLGKDVCVQSGTFNGRGVVANFVKYDPDGDTFIVFDDSVEWPIDENSTIVEVWRP